ncbi:MAG: hypothetical protein ACJAVM_000469 [Sulfitobacter sp.]|jgi:hypothetical protein
MQKIRKAVFPVAGLGTRFLPAIKALPKAELSIIDKPVIQYTVKEAVAAGITEPVFVTGPTKRAIQDHFAANPELENALRGPGQGAGRAAGHSAARLRIQNGLSGNGFRRCPRAPGICGLLLRHCLKETDRATTFMNRVNVGFSLA